MQQQRPPTASAFTSNQQQQLFDALHGELLALARAEARERGVDVRIVVFRPDGAATTAAPRAVAHTFLGAASETRTRRAIRDLLARNVSTMGAAELEVHAARLRALRAAVVRKLLRGEEELQEDRKEDAARAA